MNRRLVLALLLVSSACIGGRVGYRHHFSNSSVSGVYYGPYVEVMHIDGRAAFGADVSYMFAADSEALIVAPGTAMLAEGMQLFVFAGAEFGNDVELNLSACFWPAYWWYIDAKVCARGSTDGWVGVDTGLGVNLGGAYLLYTLSRGP